MRTEGEQEVVSKALDAVIGMTSLPWSVKTRLLRGMARAVRIAASSNVGLDDAAAILVEEFSDLIQNEDIRPHCRIALAEFFAQEVLNWLTGDFDNAAD